MINYQGIKLNKADYEIITSIIKEHHFISLTNEKPPEDDFDSCFYIENGEIIYLSLNGYTINKFPNKITDIINLHELISF